MEYALKGTVISWDEAQKKFKADITDRSEEYLRQIFRDCVKGLHYSTLTKT